MNNKFVIRTNLVQVWMPNQINQRSGRPLPQCSNRRLNASLRSNPQEEHAILPTSKRPGGIHEQNPTKYPVENRQRKQNGLGHETSQRALGVQEKFQNKHTGHTIPLGVRLGSSNANRVPNTKLAHTSPGTHAGRSISTNPSPTTPRPRPRPR